MFQRERQLEEVPIVISIELEEKEKKQNPDDESEESKVVTFHSEEISTETIRSFYFNNIKRAIPTALSYDFSIGLIAVGVMMSRLGEGESVPAVTTMLNTIGFCQFACIISASYTLSGFFGELEGKKAKLKIYDERKEDPATLEYKNVNEEILTLTKKISRTPKNTVISGFICSPVILLMIFAKPILSALHQNDEVAESAQSFLRPYAPFFLTLSTRIVMEFVLLGSKKQKAAMLIANGALLSGITMEYGLGFKTTLGLEGLGIGDGVGLVLCGIGYSSYVAYYFKNFQFFKSILSWDSEDRKQVVEFIKQSRINIFTVVSDMSISFVTSLFAGLLPGNALDLQNFAVQYLGLNALLSFASSHTTGLMVADQRGQAKAEKVSYHSVLQAAAGGVFAQLTLQLPFAVFVCASPATFGKIIGSSIDESEVRNLMLLTSMYAYVDGLRYNLLQTARALGDGTSCSILLSTGALWMGVGASYALSQYTNLGVYGLQVGLTSGAFLGLVTLANQLKKDLKAVNLEERDRRPVLNPPANETGLWCNLFKFKSARTVPQPSNNRPQDENTAQNTSSHRRKCLPCTIL